MFNVEEENYPLPSTRQELTTNALVLLSKTLSGQPRIIPRIQSCSVYSSFRIPHCVMNDRTRREQKGRISTYKYGTVEER